MPSLAETQRPLPENYERVPAPTPAPVVSGFTGQDLQPKFPVNMRCPVPPISTFTPDSSRQFYRGAAIPQFRTFTLPPLSSATGSGGGTTTTNVTSTTSSTTTVNSVLSVKTASVTTPVLNPGQYSFSTITLAKAWILQSLSVSGAARIRLYATQAAQATDALRTDSTALNFETTQGVFVDVTVDSPPWTWVLAPQPAGANGDSPQTSNAYVTVNNDAATSSSFVISLQYVALTI